MPVPAFSRSLAAAAVLLTLGGSLSAASAQAVSPEVGAVDALQALFGKHPGLRTNHAKGVVLQGRFTPSADAAALSKAAIFAGAAVPVVVRFSNPTGKPDIPENDPKANPHGMAVKFNLPDGSTVDMAMLSTKQFPVSNVTDFRDLLLAIGATKPDSPKPTPIESFVASHPSVAAFGKALPSTPASFATETYYGLNAFKLLSASGAVTPVRFRLVPAAGEQRLTPDELKAKGPNFLSEDIVARTKAGPVLFRLVAQVGEAGDPTNDATKPWPDDRRLVTLGELSIGAPVENGAAVEKTLLFMPTQLVPGIEPSDDPLIDSRATAYAESYSRRN
jgi:catalase